MERDELAKRIDEVSRLKGTFTLRSGATSDEYFDKYRFESDPGLLAALSRPMNELIPSGTEVLAGLELGGVAVAVALSRESGLPAVFVRKQAKTYGTAKIAEGCEVAGRTVLIIEDVVTTGGQIRASAAQLRSLGAEVTHALCVIDRESGGGPALGEDGVTLISLFSRQDLNRAPAVGPR